MSPGIPIESVIVMGGRPGAGKSTVALQWSDALARGSKKEAFYLCAEEGATQVRERAMRLGLDGSKIRIIPLERMGDVDLPAILEQRAGTLGSVVLDSLQGFTNELEEAVSIVKSFKFFATLYQMPFVVINQVNKDGEMAGSMKLQHAGDISLMLDKRDESERVRFADDTEADILEVRELYTEKSRYCASGRTSFYAMTERGLVPVYGIDGGEKKETDDDSHGT